MRRQPTSKMQNASDESIDSDDTCDSKQQPIVPAAANQLGQRLDVESFYSGFLWTQFLLIVAISMTASLDNIHPLRITIWTALPLVLTLSLVSEARPVDRILFLEMESLGLIPKTGSSAFPWSSRHTKLFTSEMLAQMKYSEKMSWIRRVIFSVLNALTMIGFFVFVCIQVLSSGCGALCTDPLVGWIVVDLVLTAISFAINCAVAVTCIIRYSQCNHKQH